MIDLVQAGPFTFCPSLFVAAYVEADQTKTVSQSASSSSHMYGVAATSEIDGASFSIGAGSSSSSAPTIQKSSSSTDTVPSGGVVLVLSTGSHKAKCANPESVVASIFTAVKSYFEAISPA